MSFPPQRKIKESQRKSIEAMRKDTGRLVGIFEENLDYVSDLEAPVVS